MAVLEVLERWNRWGRAELASGIKRDITPAVIRTIDAEELVVLMGPRRCGKSTILYQVMDHLENAGVSPKAILHVNFEDPALSINLNINLLDQIYDEYRAKVYPQGKAYIFFDEIQRVESWERWVRARNETEDIKIFVTGSSAQLMSRELATLLTGRHLSFTVLPLNFAEFLRFNNIKLPDDKIYSFKAPAIISHALTRYITWGGYPRIVLLDANSQQHAESAVDNDAVKQQLLLEYFDDTLFKDVALRHEIRDLTLLRNLAIHLLGNTAGLITYKRLAGIFAASPNLIQDYCHYLQEAYLIELLPFFSLKAAERLRNPQKIHAVDLGLRNLLAISGSADNGKLIETIVHNHMQHNTLDDIYYYKDNGEIDLLSHRGSNVGLLIQVMYQGLDEPKIIKRELDALLEAKTLFPKAQAKLIVAEFPSNWQGIDPDLADVVPLWKFLLDI